MVFDKEENRSLVKENLRLVTFLDVLLVLTVVFNLFAISMTNSLVVKSVPEEILVLEEANPVTAAAHGLKKSDFKKYLGIIIQFIMLGVILGGYIFIRLTMKTYEELVALACLTMLAIGIFSYDVFNDLGYWVGVNLL